MDGYMHGNLRLLKITKRIAEEDEKETMGWADAQEKLYRPE